MKMVKLLLVSLLATAGVLLGADVKNVVVYHNAKEFAGWPANEGIWSWENEILVGFEAAAFTEVKGNHSVDRDSPKRIVFARSLDGGETWKAEEHPEIAPPVYIGEAHKYVQKSATAKDPVVSPGGFDFTHPDFAMKIRADTFYVSTNRGKFWEGPYVLPDFGYIPESRTNYIVTGKSSCFIFANFRMETNGAKYARTAVVETKDGGKTFALVSWINGEDLGERYLKAKKVSEPGDVGENVFSIMPSAVKMGDRYVVSLRQRVAKAKWTDLYESTDECRTWKKLSELEKGSSNPAALVATKEGPLVAVYGNRRGRGELGVSGKISKDGGKSWGKEVMLRTDARKWDLGYARAVQRPDGKIVGIYYYTTEEMPENFIGATIWDWKAVK